MTAQLAWAATLLIGGPPNYLGGHHTTNRPCKVYNAELHGPQWGVNQKQQLINRRHEKVRTCNANYILYLMWGEPEARPNLGERIRPSAFGR